MSLVYNEIIEINCFKLSENTKRNIMKRAAMENCFNEDRNALVSFDENDEKPNNNIIQIQIVSVIDDNDNSSVYD